MNDDEWEVETPYGAQLRAQLFKQESPRERAERKEWEDRYLRGLISFLTYASGIIH